MKRSDARCSLLMRKGGRYKRRLRLGGFGIAGEAHPLFLPKFGLAGAKFRFMRAPLLGERVRLRIADLLLDRTAGPAGTYQSSEALAIKRLAFVDCPPYALGSWMRREVVPPPDQSAMLDREKDCERRPHQELDAQAVCAKRGFQQLDQRDQRKRGPYKPRP